MNIYYIIVIFKWRKEHSRDLIDLTKTQLLNVISRDENYVKFSKKKKSFAVIILYYYYSVIVPKNLYFPAFCYLFPSFLLI
jgi:hypothetical protein